MIEEGFRRLCAQRGLSEQQIDDAVSSVRRFEAFAKDRGHTFETATVDLLQEYIRLLTEKGENTLPNLLAVGRYAYLADNHALYAYMAGVVGARGVISSIQERTAEIVGQEARGAVFRDLALPQPGSSPESYPAVTQAIVESLTARLPLEICKTILTGNHHRIPTDRYEGHHRAYREGGVDGLLRFRQESLIAELEDHAKSGKLWYEQTITPKVVDLVRRNPEIQAGVRVGSAIYVSKIPFAPVEYLEETDPRMRRYYQCHCALARASILNESPKVSPLFCYCSGGYEKLPFDVVFGCPTRVTVLESALGGNDRCRFRIDIPDGCRLPV